MLSEEKEIELEIFEICKRIGFYLGKSTATDGRKTFP